MSNSNRQYVTVRYLGNAACEFTPVLVEATCWDPSTTSAIPDADAADLENPGSAFDRELRIGSARMRSNEGLIARSKAIEWARELGVPYRG